MINVFVYFKLTYVNNVLNSTLNDLYLFTYYSCIILYNLKINITKTKTKYNFTI